jgi:hypothetical protein
MQDILAIFAIVTGVALAMKYFSNHKKAEKPKAATPEEFEKLNEIEKLNEWRKK